MVFSSLLFLFRFLPLVLACYFITPKKYRNLILLIFSLLFYAWGEPIYVCLLLFSSVLDYSMGRLIGRCRENGNAKGALGCLLVSLVGNLGLLGVFKYLDFTIGTMNAIFGLDIDLVELALPIGISFYTFQTLSYSIDVYRGKVQSQHSFIAFATYVALFPQLIAGPIVRYETVAKELTDRKETLNDFSYGALRFTIGLTKKVLLANTVGAIFTEIAALPEESLSTATAWLGVMAFTLQIYFDFSGYSDMAIGLGRMFGFHFLENFAHPYESKSITEFWRRWHISLGTWFKEYVYIPLGGNRHGLGRQILNIAVVWFLTGLWHGASWNFVLWGVYYGVLLVIEKAGLLKLLSKLPKAVGHIYTMVLVVIGWAFFCYPDMTDGAVFVGALLGQSEAGFVDSAFLYYITSYAVVLILAIVGSTSLPKRVGLYVSGATKQNVEKAEVESNMPSGIRFGIVTAIFMLVCLGLSLTFLVSDSYNPFLYFRF